MRFLWRTHQASNNKQLAIHHSETPYSNSIKSLPYKLLCQEQEGLLIVVVALGWNLMVLEILLPRGEKGHIKSNSAEGQGSHNKITSGVLKYLMDTKARNLKMPEQIPIWFCKSTEEQFNSHPQNWVQQSNNQNIQTGISRCCTCGMLLALAWLGGSSHPPCCHTAQ